MRVARTSSLILFSMLLNGCMVGPDFHSPAAPKTTSYTEGPLPAQTVNADGTSQQFVMGQNLPAEWWKLFHSTELNNLISQGITNSPNLASAQAALQQAQENLRAQVGVLFPAVNAQLGATREQASNASIGSSSPGSIFNLYNASVNVSYGLDFFGGARRELEALRSQVDYERYQVNATYLALTANIATTAISTASLAAQIQATQQLIQSQEQQLAIVQQQLQAGGASQADVLLQESQAAQTRATLPPLQKNLAQSQHALATLIGVLPSESQLPNIALDQLTLPAQLPVSLPSKLVKQRPDIQAAEALLQVASAQVGVATANLFPQITLNGNYGYSSNHANTLFTSNANTWGFGGQLLQPIFNAGSLQAKKRAAVAAYQQATAQYRQTVLQAFQNVADTLRALENDAKTLREQQRAEIAAKNALKLIQTQYRLGGVSYVALLTAQRQYQQALITRIQAQATRYADTAALFQALGGNFT